MRPLELNLPNQHAFVVNEERHSAYMGGRGAGKTIASVARGLLFSQQPKVPGELPPHGCLLAISFPHLRDIVYPAMYLVFEKTGMQEGRDWKEVKAQSDRKFVLLENGAEIKMRSLDEPNKVRGLTLSWFGIDEGRLFDTDEAYKILLACLRQGTHPDPVIDEQGLWIPGENYKHAGWVTSTPMGYNWMWRRFHPDSKKRRPNTTWFNAPTYENQKNLPAAFIQDLEADYEKGSLWYRQEVLGEFVGAVHGAVWPMFDPRKHVGTVPYNPDLPLFAGWDFGMGDSSVCLFMQVEYEDKKVYDGGTVSVPKVRVVGALEKKDLSVKEFAHEYWKYLDEKFKGRIPSGMWGDPQGLHRQQASGTSTIAAFAEQGVYIRPCPRRPLDEGIIIVSTLMERPDGFLIDEDLYDVQNAIQTYRWKVDDEGTKLSKEPVHDWTSHTSSALRYFAIVAIGLRSNRHPAAPREYQPGQIGFALDRLFRDDDEIVMGEDEAPELNWHGDQVVGIGDLLDGEL